MTHRSGLLLLPAQESTPARLWCGCPADAAVEVEPGVWICGRCSDPTPRHSRGRGESRRGRTP